VNVDDSLFTAPGKRSPVKKLTQGIPRIGNASTSKRTSHVLSQSVNITAFTNFKAPATAAPKVRPKLRNLGSQTDTQGSGLVSSSVGKNLVKSMDFNVMNDQLLQQFVDSSQVQSYKRQKHFTSFLGLT